jgi:FkbM family methyltransferase
MLGLATLGRRLGLVARRPAGHTYGLQRRRYVLGLTRVEMGGDTFLLPKFGLRRAARTIRDGGPHEPATHALVHALLRETPGDMVHAGTFFGPMLPSFSRACRGTLYAFEPVLESYVVAKLAVQLNGLGNVVMFNAGLADRLARGFVETERPDGQHSAARAEIAEHGQAVALMTIDMLGLHELALIQLDVEGHEFFALKGAEATIRAQRPLVMVEDNSRRTSDYLEGLGYRFVGRLPGQRLYATPERLALARAALAEAEPMVPKGEATPSAA